MKDRSRVERSPLSRVLGMASLGLGVPNVVAGDAVARVAGVDDLPGAQTVIRVAGLREIAQAGALLLGPPRMAWTRVAGDAVDLAALGWALRARNGDGRPRRTKVATAAVAAITAVDVVAAVRSGRESQHGEDRPGPLRLRTSTTINRTPEEVYAYWRDFEHLPTFMQHVRSVTDRGDGLWHWEVRAPMRRTVEWDAELTGDEPARRISWRSLPGGDIDNSGTVHFAPAPGERGTEVSVVLHYDVPGGRIGEAVAKMFGAEPEQQVRDDLRRFKQVMETGDVVRSEALPTGPDAAHQVLQRRAQAWETSDEGTPG